MYQITKLVQGHQYWEDILLSRDWSMLRKLSLCNKGNTQITVKLASVHY